MRSVLILRLVIGTPKERGKEKGKTTKERAKERALVLKARKLATDSIKANAVTKNANLNIFATNVFRKVTTH